MAYNPLKLGSLTESKEALSASLYKVNTMLSELYTINTEGDFSAVSQDIIPDTDSTRDLGAPEKQWRSLYVSTNTIYIGGKAVSVSDAGNITVDGTSYLTNALPSQTDQAGNYLTTDGNGTLSWDTVTVSNQGLNTTDDVTFNSITSTTDFINIGSGVPSFISSTNINLTAANAVLITSSPLRLARFTTLERDALVAVIGDTIYNTTLGKFQGYQNGEWINLEKSLNLTSTTAIVNNSITIDLSKSLIEITLTDDISSIQFTNVPPAGSSASTTIVFTQDGTGGRTVSGTGFLTQSGLGLSVSSAPFSLSVINFVAYGSTIIGFNVGKDYQ